MVDFDSAEYVRTLQPGEIRISKRHDYGRGPMRYAETRLEDTDALEYAVEKGEVVLRQTPTGARQLKAKFFETNRHIFQLTLNFFTEKTGNPHKGSFPLRADEINKLQEFIDDLQRVHLATSGRVIVEPGALKHSHFTDDELIAAVRQKPDLVAQIIESEATSGDIKAVSYRRKSLERFERLLNDVDFFENERRSVSNHSAEQVWQDFFEQNHWVFGYGLSYVFMSGVDPEKLQKDVAGYSIAWKGKKPDAVMKTRGAVSALCLVEIKRHDTELLRPTPNRPGAYGPSQEVADAIGQCQASVLSAARQLGEDFQPVDKQGDPMSESIYNYRPPSYLIAGRLSEFQTELGPNREKFSSFEMFRRNLVSPEIITFDELYERARFIVEHPN